MARTSKTVCAAELCDHTGPRFGRRVSRHKVGGINENGLPFCEYCMHSMAAPPVLGGQGRTATDLVDESRQLVVVWSLAMAAIVVACVAWRILQ